MSLVQKYFLSNFTYRTVSSCRYIFKGTGFNCAQYHTCLKCSANVQTIFNYRKLEEHGGMNLSVMAYVKENGLTERVKSAVTNIRTIFPFASRKHKILGYTLYQTLDELNIEEFFTLLKMKDCFYSRFLVIQLHVWMILCHLPKEGRVNNFVRLGVIEAMWKDTEKRALIINEERSIRRTLKLFYRNFLFFLMYFDEAFQESDIALANALWLGFLNKCNDDPRLLEASVSYVRYQMHHLNKINFEAFFSDTENSKVTFWTPLRPHIEKVMKL